MAMGMKTGGRNFVKGNPGGPGKPVIPPELKGVDLLTRTIYSRMISKTMGLTREELQAIIENPQSTVLEVALASIMDKAISSGDQMRVEGLMTRSIGPIKQEIASSVEIFLGEAEPETVRKAVRIAAHGNPLLKGS